MKILISGSIAIDRIMNFNGRFADVIRPEKLHVLSLSVLIDQLKETRGGVAANIAYTLALFGVHPVLYGSVGTNAREYMDALSSIGVDTSLVHYSTMPTATFSVITDKADCQVGGFYPGAMSDSASLSFRDFSSEEVYIVISPHDPAQMNNQVNECIEMNKPYFYDVGQQVSNISAKDLRLGVEHAQLLIVNDYEMGVILEKTELTQAEIIKKVRTVAITLGERGSLVWEDGVRVSVPAVAKVLVADPTGAGDAYRAGFLYGVASGASGTVCAQLGSIAAAYAIETTGTQEHFFTKEQFRERFKKHFGSSPVLE